MTTCSPAAPTRPTPPKPPWLKVRAPGGDTHADLKRILRSRGLVTVCEEARCPNVGECWGGGTATFMVMGDTCTRGCRFCAVTSAKTGRPLDPDEPRKVAEAVAEMDLEYVVLTSVDRDDLADQGAGHFAEVIRELRARHPRVIREVLIPDFQGRDDLLRTVADARPEVLAHNVEVVRRLTGPIRDARCDYDVSLDVLRRSKRMAPDIFTKSSIMVGLGETEDEVLETLDDLRAADCDVVTIGQYLRPTLKHAEVVEYVHPDVFERWREAAEARGFLYVASGPLVRSSYRAGEFFLKGVIESRRRTRDEVLHGSFEV